MFLARAKLSFSPSERAFQLTVRQTGVSSNACVCISTCGLNQAVTFDTKSSSRASACAFIIRPSLRTLKHRK